MKYLFHIVMVVLFLSEVIFAQNIETNKNSELIDHTIYFEVGGLGGIYSINYEHKFTSKIGGRVGISYTPAAFENLTTMPISVSYLVGNNKHYFEVGAGVTMFYAGTDDLIELDFSSENNNTDKEIFDVGVGAILGYRLEPNTGNLFFRLAAQPIYIPRSNAFAILPGIALGYSF